MQQPPPPQNTIANATNVKPATTEIKNAAGTAGSAAGTSKIGQRRRSGRLQYLRETGVA